jgi:hypothetical protein
MADWNRLFRLSEFEEYRREQARLMAVIVHNYISGVTKSSQGAEDIKHLPAVIDALEQMINLPMVISDDEELRSILTKQIKTDMANVTGDLISHMLTD